MQTGVDREGRRNIDLMRAAQVNLVALFSPEHGFGTPRISLNVSDSVDSATGIKIFSLYGKTERPTPEMLRGLDALVFDIQDVGARFYTYETTMAYSMEAAAKAGIAYYVLDRPNPITGVHVEGPLLDARAESFVGYYPAARAARHDHGRTGQAVQRGEASGRQADRGPDEELAARRLVRCGQSAVDQSLAQHAQLERRDALSRRGHAGGFEELFRGPRHGCALRADRRGVHRRPGTGGLSESPPHPRRTRVPHAVSMAWRACAS